MLSSPPFECWPLSNTMKSRAEVGWSRKASLWQCEAQVQLAMQPAVHPSVQPEKPRVAETKSEAVLVWRAPNSNDLSLATSSRWSEFRTFRRGRLTALPRRILRAEQRSVQGAIGPLVHEIYSQPRRRSNLRSAEADLDGVDHCKEVAHRRRHYVGPLRLLTSEVL